MSSVDTMAEELVRLMDYGVAACEACGGSGRWLRDEGGHLGLRRWSGIILQAVRLWAIKVDAGPYPATGLR